MIKKMQQRLISSEPFFRILLLGCTPLLMCLLTCLRNGVSLADVYLANSSGALWNDELFYYKTIEGIAKFNEPLGYFGYNGSHAQVGHLGAWSPIGYVFYIIWAKIFGWSMSSPVFCNIALMTAAMFIFAVLVRPTKRQTLFLCLLYASCSLFTRFTLSGMLEASSYFVLVIFMGIAVRAYRSADDTYKAGYVILLNILALFLTLMRPYWVMLFAVPAWYQYRKSGKKAFFGGGVLSIVSLASYFFIVQRYCAQYFSASIKLDWLKLLLTDPLKGIYNALNILVVSVWTFLQSIGVGIVSGERVGALFCVIGIAIIYFIYSAKYSSEGKKAKMAYAYGAICFLLMMLAIFYLYVIDAGSRNLLGFILIFVLVFALTEKKNKRYLSCLAAFIWLFCVRATDIYTYQIPIHTEKKEAELAKGAEALENAKLLDENADDPWDNTIIWIYEDETRLDFTSLYALPGGIGINVYRSGVTDLDHLKAKYLITNIGEKVDLLCEDKKKELKAEYANVHVWQLR